MTTQDREDRGKGTKANAETNPTGFGFGSNEANYDLVIENAQNNRVADSGTGVATTAEINATVNYILNNKKLERTQANFDKIIVASAVLVQSGATSPKYADSRNSSEFGVEVKVADLRAGAKAAGITVRKYARGIRSIVIKVAKTRDIEGNLAKAYKLENPKFDQQDLPWVADFQTFNDDPAMPIGVKEWLLDNYRNRFKPNAKVNAKNQPAGEQKE